MRRALLALALAWAGCAGAGGDVASATMALSTSGLSPADVGAVEVLVLGGAGASCARALAAGSPLDDPGLEVVAHALFTVDGTAKHLSIPANRPLLFYAEAYRSTVAPRTRVGRGCVQQTLGAGASTGVMIAISSGE